MKVKKEKRTFYKTIKKKDVEIMKKKNLAVYTKHKLQHFDLRCKYCPCSKLVLANGLTGEEVRQVPD